MAIRHSQSKARRFGGRRLASAAGQRGSASRDRKPELLEDRVLLAVVGIQTNDGTLLSLAPGARNVAHEAPRDLTLVFAETDTITQADLDNGILDVDIRRANFDGLIGNGNDVVVQPGFVGVGETPNSVVVRFAETLPDDLYQIQVVGGPQTVSLTVQLDLNLGAQIISVVTQPISRDTQGALVQATDQIDIYFNDDDLFATAVDSDDFALDDPDLPSVIDPRYYQLIYTNDTASNQDNGETHLPIFISYDPVMDKATLTFEEPIDQLSTGPGTYRLRVGTDEVAPQAPVNSIVPVDPGSSFDTARVLGSQFDTSPVIQITDDGSGIVEGSTITITDDTSVTRVFEFSEDLAVSGSNLRIPYVQASTPGAIAANLAAAINNSDLSSSAVASGNRVSLNRDRSVTLGSTTRGVFIEQSQSLILQSEIVSPDFELDFPGAIDEPGHRDIFPQSHYSTDPFNPAYPSDFADQNAGPVVIPYNFQDNYGSAPGTGQLSNLITEAQKARVREVLGAYSDLFGIDFFETEFSGVTIATGDLRAVNPLIDTGRGGTLSISGGGLIVLDAAERWDDKFGFSTLQQHQSYHLQFMHELSTFLGLGPAYELPNLTVATDIPVTYPFFGIAPEGVFPGDHDIVHGQHLYRPDSTDIDLYKFELADDGLFSAETIAERLSDDNPRDSSLLNTFLRLYRESPEGGRELIAQNDDYFSNDSLIELQLGPGTYYLGVSASGNENYDPTIEDTGIGGTSEGPYDLRMTFRPNADNAITDTDVRFIGSNQLPDPQELDGDADGKAGGVFNHWFRAVSPADTLIVDSSAPAGGNGSLAAPYNELDVAFQNAGPGDVVRVVGNGGDDGNPDTLADNDAVVVGIDPVTGFPLKDGTTVKVPKNVSLVVDAGAIFKMRRSSINVGSSAPQVDRGDGSLQVLGTPFTPVYFTSYNDESIGKDTNVQIQQTPVPSNWGGLVFRNDLDRSENRPGYIDYELNGIFLNYVNHADIRYGGGNVSVDSVEREFTSIDMTDARPTITHNTITLGAVAAISANPDSFLESNFHDPRTQSLSGAYTADYVRIGPEIHGNKLVAQRLSQDLLTLETQQNTLNGLFIRIPTEAGQPLEQLTVTGRFNDVDIPHIISENLVIVGTPGGPVGTIDTVPPNTPPADRFQLTARTDAQLRVDAGIVVKMDGARIDVQQSAQFIAEAIDGLEAVFTSLQDTRYGGAGTFDTASNADPDDDGILTNLSEAGDWAGIYAAPFSAISLDHALLAYGGGSAAIEGGFGSFNVVEIHQADARIGNSVFEFSGDGTRTLAGSDDPGRAGRAINADAVIFIRGAQPVIVNNIIRDSISIDGDIAEELEVPAISINANALNKDLVSDPGRMTGMISLGANVGNDIDTLGRANQGPFIRGNVLDNNEINGLEVREAILTTESVWDDPDIVHVLRGEIRVPDFHSFGGLRLESSATESLIVKLDGDNAGFTTFGRELDIDDRIGGILHVIGQPDRPVILTSLMDDSVGAGLTQAGALQTDTNNDGSATTPAPGDWRGILIDDFSHDRNVQTVVERESANAAAPGFNATPDNAQFLGFLADREYHSDETLRLGFTVHGTLSQPNDIDVYSFTGRPGTEVWLDIDRTTHSLDTIVELINSDAEVLARSDNSLREHETTESRFEAQGTLTDRLQSTVFNPKDHWSTNTRDAGMRLILPGQVGGPELTYHIRVRSSSDNVAGQLLGGKTAGVYQLQVRLREIDEFGGSTVQFANIAYATDGITVEGGPTHSPLAGEATEDPTPNETFPNAQNIGNVLQSDRGVISVAGNLAAGNDVDWYQFDVQYDSPPIGGAFPAFEFDLDYADGIARANTTLAIYDTAGQLIFSSFSSNVGDDQPGPLSQAGDLTDLSRGSVGGNDPLIGGIHLPEGTYFVAVSSAAQTPADLDQFTSANPINPLLRAEPVDSLVRIAEDHISFSGGSTGFDPLTENLFEFEYRVEVRDVADIKDGETIRIVGPGTEFLVAGLSQVFEFDDDGIQNDPNSILIDLIDPFTLERYTEEELAQEISFAVLFSGIGVGAFVDFDNPRLVELSDASWVEQTEAPGSDFVGLQLHDPSTRPFTLQDVTLFVSSSGNLTSLATVDPFTGGIETVAGQFGVTVGDIAMRHDGGLYAYSIDDQGNNQPADADSGNFLKIDPGNASVQVLRDDGIQTFEPDMNGMPQPSHDVNGTRVGDGIQFQAITFGDVFAGGFAHPDLFAVGNRGLFAPGADYYTNILYWLDGSEYDQNNRAPGLPFVDDNMGRLGRAATDVLDRGHIDTNLDAGGGSNSVLLSREATQVNTATNPIIRDKDGFVLEFNDGGTITQLFEFEFDSGPDATLHFDANSGAVPDNIFDGEFFTLSDGAGNVERFEFDTGPVMVVGNFPPGSLVAGDQFVLTDNAGQSRTFVMDDVNDVIDPPQGQIAIQFDSRPILGTTPQQFLTSLLGAINNSPLNVNAVVTGSGRITLTGDANLTGLTPAGSFQGLSQDGMSGIANPGDHRIAVEETDSPAVVRQAIANVINGIQGSTAFPGIPNVTVGLDGRRLNFHMTNAAGIQNPPVVGDFSGTPSMVTVADTNGGSATGGTAMDTVALQFLAQDTEFDTSDLITDTILAMNIDDRRFDLNNDGVWDIQLEPQNNGSSVTFDFLVNPFGNPPGPNAAVEIVTQLPFQTGAPAPGGLITGIAIVDEVLYAVTNTGGLFAIDDPTAFVPTANGDALIQADFVNTAVDLDGINFAGLTAGPPLVEGGKYADLLFGISTGGELFAFNTQGELQPIFAGGDTSVSTGVGGVNGLAFSSLDYNLWSTTGARGNDPGHGLTTAPDGSRVVPVPGGGTSLRFGNSLPAYSTNNVSGQETTNNYQFPGGAHGSIVSEEISLAGYSAADQPTIYFNYFLDTEGAASNPYAAPPIHMRDSIRVFVSTNDDDNDNGDWHLIATNNSFRGPAPDDDEFDWSAITGFPIQELFDNTGNWRQARISLANYAGVDKIRLRFDFSTAGGMNLGGFQVGQELTSRPGAALRDGQTVEIFDNNNPFDTTVFEFDLGYTLVPPSGGEIQDAETFQITDINGIPQIFEFDKDNFFARNMVAVDGSQIADGDTFVVRSGTIEQAFEFESGYTLNVGTDPATFLADVAEGDSISIDNGFGGVVDFELDGNGSVSPGATRVSIADSNRLTVPLFGGGFNGVQDGDTFTITDGLGTTLATFEFESVGGLNDLNNIGITITQTSSQNQIANAIVTAINGAFLGLFATNQGAGNVGITGTPHVIDASGTPSLSLSAVTVATPDIIAERLGFAIFNAGLGLVPTPIGNGVLNVGGTTHTIDGTNAPGIDVIGAPGTTDPNAIPVPYLNSAADTDVMIAQAIATAINSASTLGVTATPNGAIVELSDILVDTQFSPGDTAITPELVIPTRITSSTSAGNIAELMALLIEQSPLDIRARVDGNRVNLTGAVDVQQSFDPSLNRPGLFIDGAPGVQTDHVRIPIHSDMSQIEVAKQITRVFNETLAPAADAAGYIITPNSDTRIQLLNGSVVDSGPLGLDGDFSVFPPNPLEGDYTPPLASFQVHAFDDSIPPYAGSLRGMDNNHEGVFIDDIIIGFAERGEMITNSGVTPGHAGGTTAGTNIVTGEYNLEIRRASEYGIPSTVPPLFLVRSLDTNDRFGEEITIFAPSGDQVGPTDTLEINGTTFEYVDATIREPNDVIANSQHTGITPTGSQRFLGFGRIGDNNGPAGDNNNPIQGLDVDLLRMDLNEGDAVQIDIDSLIDGDDLFSYLRIFDASGIELANSFVNQDAPGEVPTLDPFILFFAPQPGTYYIGVSGVNTDLGIPNNDYDPFTEGSGTFAATSNGTYQLEVIVNGADEPMAGNVPVRYATFDDAATIANRITAAINSDLVQDEIRLGVTADSILTSERVNLHGEVVAVGNAFADFPEDVLESNDTVDTATQTGIVPGGTSRYKGAGVIGDNPDFLYEPFSIGIDVDMFAIDLAAGDVVDIDVDAWDIGTFNKDLNTGKLDPLLRVFQIDETTGLPFEIALVDDAGAPGEYPFGYGFLPLKGIGPFLDTYHSFIAPEDGTYYVGISSFENFLYNPSIAGSGDGFTSGPYEITIEVGGPTVHGITQQIFHEDGDDNAFRDQGQIILSGNRISNSENFAINVLPGDRDPNSGNPSNGPVRHFVEINDRRLVPSVTITNNVIFNNEGGGIHFAGDPNLGPVPVSSTPFGRIVNNTIYGGGTGTGIEVQDFAAPTILNNILSNLTTGISINGSSILTQLGANLYQDAPNVGIGLGDFAITLGANDPLFVSPTTGNFYLATGSAAIDSSRNSLEDRPDLTTVRDPIGIGRSPVLAPDRDALGQLRVDDPSIEPPDGFGSQVFKDRGAIDRADFTGPRALFLEPRDNDAEGFDQNPAPTIIETSGQAVTVFSIEFEDGFSPIDPSEGSGVDPSSVTTDAVVVMYTSPDRLTTTTLFDGTDYTFEFDAVNDILNIIPIAGVWAPGYYEITLANPPLTTGAVARISDLAGNVLQANQPNGTVSFTVAVADDLDYGDLPENYTFTQPSGLPTVSYITTQDDNGPRHHIQPGFHLGSSVDAELDGRPDGNAQGDDGLNSARDDEDGVRLRTILTAGGVPTVAVTASAAGRLDAWMDFNRDGDFNDLGEQIFTSQSLATGTNVLNFNIPENIPVGEVFARFRFSSAGGLTPGGEALDGEVEDYKFTISPPGWQNPRNRFDVDDRGTVTTLDALLIVSALRNNNNSAFNLPNPPAPPVEPPPFLDVNGDNRVTISDALGVISFIAANRNQGGGEGESVLFVEPAKAASVGGTVDTAEIDVKEDLTESVSSQIGEDSLISELTLSAQRKSVDDAFSVAEGEESESVDLIIDEIADDVFAEWSDS